MPNQTLETTAAAGHYDCHGQPSAPVISDTTQTKTEQGAGGTALPRVPQIGRSAVTPPE